MLTKHAGFTIALHMLMCAIDLQDRNRKRHFFPDHLSSQLPFPEITTVTERWPPEELTLYVGTLRHAIFKGLPELY